jgi:membrane fusion protein (multidrug efflux system)
LGPRPAVVLLLGRLPEDLNVTRMTSVLGFLAAVSVGQRAALADESATPPDRIVVRRCVTAYQRSSLLGAATHGILQDCLVRQGDHVKANQVLGRLFDKDVRADADLFKAKCESDLAIRLCAAKHNESLAKLRASNALRLRNMMSQEDYKLDQLDATTAELELEGAKFDARLNEIRLRNAEAIVKAREIVSPHDGIVEEVFRGQNETVSPNEPAFHVVDVSRVRVTGYVDVSNAWRVKTGQAVRVMAEIGGADLPIEDQVFAGRVVFIDRLIDKKNQTCRVVAEVANPEEQLRAGLEARMEVSLNGDVAENAAPAPAPNPSPAPPVGEEAAAIRSGAAVLPSSTEARAKR